MSVSGVVSRKTGGELGSGEMVDEVAKTGGEVGGGEVAGDVVGKRGEESGRGEVVVGVAGKTGGELGGGEEVVPSGDDAGTISVFEGDTWKPSRASQQPSTSLAGLL
jgi:hypothetical protein